MNNPVYGPITKRYRDFLFSCGGNLTGSIKSREAIIEIIRSRKTRIPTLPVVVNNILQVTADDCESCITIGSLLAVHLFVLNRPLGFLNMSYTNKEAFAQEELKPFEIIAGFVARSIHSTWRSGSRSTPTKL